MITNERILVYGGPGSGKSEGWLSIAKVQPDSVFYCIDTDKSIKRLIDTDYTDIANVKIVECRTWDIFSEAVNIISDRIKNRPQDWLIIDFSDALWQFVQDWFSLNVFDKKFSEYLLQIRQAVKDKNVKALETLKGWTDWIVINGEFQDKINRICYEFDCNMYFTAKSKPYVKADVEDTPEMRNQFLSVGASPDGEKRMSYRMHTVLYFSCSGDGYFIDTIKDRGRQKVRNFKYSSDDNRHTFNEFYEKIIRKQPVKEIE